MYHTMNSDILYQIGNQINDHITFFNFIISFKNIRNKEALIKQKRQQFVKCITSYYRNVDRSIKEIYYILPNHMMEGLYQLWHYNGKLLKQYNFINDGKEGLYQSWHENSERYEQYNNVNGKREGLYQLWFDNKQLCKQYNYINDKIEGLYQEWHRNGQLYKQYNYINGKKI
jgi:antitoxin component YwqK of YwqJK toxin-antitoxin module